jgi:hypothetical protein
MSIKFGDICLFNGRAYAVDETGRTVMVGPDNSDIRLAAEPLVGGGYIKFLVESEGDLLLADVYDCLHTRFPNHDPVRIDLFKLKEKEKKWVKLASLGDRFCSWGRYLRFLFLHQICVFPKGIVSSLWIISLKHICTINMRNVFCTWIKLGFRLCPITLNILICCGHLRSALKGF